MAECSRRLQRAYPVALLLLASCGPGPVLADPGPDPVVRPVMYGNDDDLDGCGGTGVAIDPATRQPAALTVLSAPGRHGRPVYDLAPDEEFWICDGTDDQGWTGIVVKARERGRPLPDLECDAAEVVPSRRAYPGPCLSGWVPAESVLLIAG